jgi:intraflagellar transport protein 52
MKPKFEVPLPLMKLAVFPPEFTSHAPPLLELFDFDQEFASDEVKLARIANKCTDAELKYFIGESAKICGFECDGSDKSLRKVLSESLKAIIKQTVPESDSVISSAEK